MSDGIMGIFGQLLSARESLETKKEALREAFGTKMMGEERWKAYKTLKERRKKTPTPQQPHRGQGNYPQGTLGG